MVFVHGWPDNFRGFDQQVDFFKDRLVFGKKSFLFSQTLTSLASKRYRCLRIVMPFCGEDESEFEFLPVLLIFLPSDHCFSSSQFGAVSADGKNYSRWGYNFETNAEMIANTIQHHAPNESIILVVHDWGVHWGGYFQVLLKIHRRAVFTNYSLFFLPFLFSLLFSLSGSSPRVGLQNDRVRC